MKKQLAFLLLLYPVLVFSQEDAPGCKDSPMFTRMPHMVIENCSSNYDEMEIAMSADKKETLEGTRSYIKYYYELEEATAPSFFQIVKNFENAILKVGGKRIYYTKEDGIATFKSRSENKDVWIVLNDLAGVRKGNFELITLEMEGMKQDISASDMLEAINKNGSVALQINFETGKSVIEPASQTIVDQIAEMLQSDPALKVSIQGHTDNTGSAAANKTLSENRAKAVMNALIAKGIAQSRLSSKGWGQEKPVADNATDEGKAKNRRVEIVKI
jgi:OOP family OmpA-OmpF porin